MSHCFKGLVLDGDASKVPSHSATLQLSHLVDFALHKFCSKILPVSTGYGLQASGELPAFLSLRQVLVLVISGDSFEEKASTKFVLRILSPPVSLSFIIQGRKAEGHAALQGDCLCLIVDHSISMCLQHLCVWKLHRHDINHLRFPSNNVTQKQQIQSIKNKLCDGLM